jgi:hypothetical protein
MSAVVPVFAKIDPVTLETGLFRVLPKQRGGVQLPFSIEHEHAGVRFQYIGHHVDHIGLGVFLGAAGVAAIEGMSVSEEVQDARVQSLIQNLQLSENIANSETLLWHGKLLDLAEACGVSRTTSGRKTVLARLEQLASLKLHQDDGEQEFSQHILSYTLDPSGKKIAVMFGPHLARYITATGKRQFVKIDLEKFRVVEEPAAKILHAVFSSRIKPSQRHLSTLRGVTLSDTAFGPTDSVDTLRYRYSCIKRAIKDLDAAGWAVFHDTSGNRAYGIMPLENVDPRKWQDYEIQRRKVSKS